MNPTSVPVHCLERVSRPQHRERVLRDLPRSLFEFLPEYQLVHFCTETTDIGKEAHCRAGGEETVSRTYAKLGRVVGVHTGWSRKTSPHTGYRALRRKLPQQPDQFSPISRVVVLDPRNKAEKQALKGSNCFQVTLTVSLTEISKYLKVYIYIYI